MAKLTKEELKTKVNGMSLDSDVVVSLLEDIEDSFNDSSEEVESLKTTITDLEGKLDDITARYKERFLSGSEEPKEEENEEKDVDEKEIIDVQDI